MRQSFSGPLQSDADLHDNVDGYRVTQEKHTA